MPKRERKPDSRIDTHVYLDPAVLLAVKAVAKANARSVSSEIGLTLTRYYLGKYTLVPA